MLALRDIVLSGKALYVGLSNYNSEQLKCAYEILKRLNVPYVITQPSYSMLNRWIEHDNLLETQNSLGGGTICFSALSQGRLSNKYIHGIPEDSRAKKDYIIFLHERDITPDLIEKLKKLDIIARRRNQTISQMALAWVLRNPKMTSTLIGISKIEQLKENLDALNNLEFSEEEIKEIDEIVGNNKQSLQTQAFNLLIIVLILQVLLKYSYPFNIKFNTIGIIKFWNKCYYLFNTILIIIKLISFNLNCRHILINTYLF